MSFFNSCSVDSISRHKPLYCSWLTFPFSPTCDAACFSACRNVVSFCDVSLIAFFRRVCFCLKSSVFVGSSFKSLLTSLSSSCVIFMALFVPFNALCSFVVSPPISIVIPAILLFALMNHLPQKTAPDLTSEAVKIFLTCQKRPVIVII